jgi:hypothetical protein
MIGLPVADLPADSCEHSFMHEKYAKIMQYIRKLVLFDLCQECVQAPCSCSFTHCQPKNGFLGSISTRAKQTEAIFDKCT